MKKKDYRRVFRSAALNISAICFVIYLDKTFDLLSEDSKPMITAICFCLHLCIMRSMYIEGNFLVYLFSVLFGKDYIKEND